MAKTTRPKVLRADSDMIRLKPFRVGSRHRTYRLVMYFNQRTRQFVAHCEENGFVATGPTWKSCEAQSHEVATFRAERRRLIEIVDYFSSRYRFPPAVLYVERWEELRLADGKMFYVNVTHPCDHEWEDNRPGGLLLIDCPESRKIVKSIERQLIRLRDGIHKRLRGKGPTSLAVQLPAIPRRLVAYRPID